jgi:hypothetical protein
MGRLHGIWRALRWLALIAGLAIAAGAAWAAPAHVDEHVAGARLAGKGTFTFFALKIYDAELWVGPQGYQEGAPFALELRYARKLDGLKIADASAEQMEKNGAGTAAQRKAWLGTMREIFPDVRDGSRITGVNVPGVGALFYLDGKLLGSVPDVQFARAFFGIWLGTSTTAPALRKALLAHGAPQ